HAEPDARGWLRPRRRDHGGPRGPRASARPGRHPGLSRVRTVGKQFTSSPRAAEAPHLPPPRRGEDDEWQEAMPFEDLWIGEMIGLELAGVPVLLVNIEAEVGAYVDSCPHQRSRLSEGELAGRALTCGTHRWEFDALTGQGLN